MAEDYKYPQKLAPFKKMLEIAIGRLISSNPDPRRLRIALENGDPIPDKCKPGQLLSYLTDEEKSQLKTLTSDDLNSLRLDEIDKMMIDQLKLYR